MPEHSVASRRSDVVLCFALVLACVCAYAGKLSGPLLFDDAQSLIDNPSIRALDARCWAPPRETPVAGRPLLNATFALNYALAGLSPAPLHATNLALHALVALLAFLLLRATLAHGRLPDALREHAPVLSFAPALWFALHPLGSEVVLYATQRSESLMAAFYLASLLLVAHAAARGRVLMRDYTFALALALGGALSKEVYVTLPLCALFYDRAFFSGSFRSAFAARGKLYLALTSSAFVLAVLQRNDPRPGSVRAFELDYLIAQGKVLSDYVGVALWPAHPALDYGPLVPQSLAASWPYVLRTGTFALVGSVLAFTHPRVGFLAVFVLGILAPSSGVLSIHTEIGAERRFYLPLLALLAYLAVLVQVALQRAAPALSRTLFGAVTFAVALALGLVTRTHADTFESARSAWLAAVQARPENPRAYYNLGETLRREGDLEGAEHAFAAALDLYDGYVDAHVNLSGVLLSRDRTLDALAHAKRAAELAPRNPDARYAYGFALGAAGRLPHALTQLTAALAQNPAHVEARVNLAFTLIALARPRDAEVQVRWLRALRPQDPRGEILAARLRALREPLDVSVAPLPDAVVSRPQGTWLGADAAYSIDLGPKVLWLYGDTFVDPKADGSRENGPNFFVRNTIALQSGADATIAHDLERATLDYHTGPEQAGVPSAFLRDADDDLPGFAGAGTWIWPLHGARLQGGELLLFRMHVALAKGGLGFAVTGWDAVAVDDPLVPPSRWQMREVAPLTAADANSGKLLGASVLRHGEHLYVYAAQNDPRAHAIYLARFALTSLRGLARGALADPQWWCGQARGFVPQSGGATPEPLFRDGQIELSVSYLPQQLRFVEIQTQGGLLGDPSTAIGARFAPAPEGPWTPLAAFHRPVEGSRPDAANLLTYAAKAHPEQLARGGGLALTYVVNDLKHPVPPDALYYPRALRATLTPRGPRAPASP